MTPYFCPVCANNLNGFGSPDDRPVEDVPPLELTAYCAPCKRWWAIAEMQIVYKQQ